MARKITTKQKKFAQAYLETGNATKSALAAYETTSSDVAKAIGSENLTKPNVSAYLASKAQEASERIVTLSNQDINLPVALGAAKDILDRAGYKAVEKHIVITKKLITFDV